MTDSTSSAAESKGVTGRGVRALAFMAQEAPIFRAPTSALKRPQVEVLPPTVYRYVPRHPASVYLPVQKVVDRHKKRPLELDRTVRDEVRPGAILRLYPNGNFGLDPNDPGAFSLPTSFGTAICPTLASYAAARCSLR